MGDGHEPTGADDTEQMRADIASLATVLRFFLWNRSWHIADSNAQKMGASLDDIMRRYADREASR
jgi:hypothetical protein